jgi:hypothetical protein
MEFTSEEVFETEVTVSICVNTKHNTTVTVGYELLNPFTGVNILPTEFTNSVVSIMLFLGHLGRIYLCQHTRRSLKGVDRVPKV